MTSDERPSAAPVSAHGTEPTLPLDGQDPTHSAYKALAEAVVTQALLIERLVMQNQELMDRLLGDDEAGEQDEGHGVDMAGKPIRTS